MQRFGRQHVNRSQTLLRSSRSHFHTTLPLISDRGSRKILVLVRSEILEQFVNTLTADYQQSRWNRKNLWQKVPRQISRELNTFSEFFIAFLKSTLNLEYFQKKDQSQTLSITEIVNCEAGSYLSVQNPIFHATLRKTTSYQLPNTAQISMEPISYCSSINFS